LNEAGIAEALDLNMKLASKGKFPEDFDFLASAEAILISPLTRAAQTSFLALQGIEA